MGDALIETWQIHNRIHLYLLDAAPEESLLAQMNGKGRNVAGLFAHCHNVRLMWLQAAAPELLTGLTKFDAKTNATKAELAAGLQASGVAMETLLRQAIAAGGKIKGFKPHVTAFVGYLIAHESHHRGQIEWALKASGQPLDDKISYGLWEWGVR